MVESGKKHVPVLFSGNMAQLMNFMALLIFPFKWGGQSFPSSAVWKSRSCYTQELVRQQARHMWPLNLLSGHSFLTVNCAIMIINYKLMNVFFCTRALFPDFSKGLKPFLHNFNESLPRGSNIYWNACKLWKQIYPFRRQVLAICRIPVISGGQLWAGLIKRGKISA